MEAKEGIRFELEYKRDMVRGAREALGEQIWAEGRNPTESEYDTLGQLSDKVDGYQDLLDKFYRPPRVVTARDLAEEREFAKLLY